MHEKNCLEMLTLKQALENYWPDAKPGMKRFLNSEIQERWKSLYLNQNGHDTDNESELPREIAMPFIARMVPVAIAELNSRYIIASMRGTTTNVEDNT
jgi:hypothetical protein